MQTFLVFYSKEHINKEVLNFISGNNYEDVIIETAEQIHIS